MNFAKFKNSNLTMAYKDVNPHLEETIIFLNGNSHSQQSFNHQLSDNHLNNFRLITVDLPGHGDSSSLKDYSLILLSDFIVEFVNLLKIKKFILVGHSLGGHVAIHSLSSLFPVGLVIFGTPPLTHPLTLDGFLDNPAARALSQDSTTPAELELLCNELRYHGSSRKQFTEDFLKANKAFRSKLIQSIFNGHYKNEHQLIKNFSGKILNILSLEDKLINNEYLQNLFKDSPDSLISVNTGHSPQIENSTLFNYVIGEFCKKTFALSDQTTSQFIDPFPTESMPRQL